MTEYHFERVADDDPNRCQGVKPTQGQCNNKAIEGSQFCPAHGGNRGANELAKEKKFMYQLTKFKARMADFATNPAIKGLREEIGVLRMVLETTINRCKDEHDLMLASTGISNMVCNIERMVTSCHKLEMNLGQLLDRNKAMLMADEMIQIITSEIKDEEVITRIARQIGACMNRVTEISQD